MGGKAKTIICVWKEEVTFREREREEEGGWLLHSYSKTNSRGIKDLNNIENETIKVPEDNLEEFLKIVL